MIYVRYTLLWNIVESYLFKYFLAKQENLLLTYII